MACSPAEARRSGIVAAVRTALAELQRSGTAVKATASTWLVGARSPGAPAHVARFSLAQPKLRKLRRPSQMNHQERLIFHRPSRDHRADPGRSWRSRACGVAGVLTSRSPEALTPLSVGRSDSQ
jgi:hypothetical protein